VSGGSQKQAPERLTDERAAFLADPGLQRLFDLVEAAGGEMRVNGGAVRNALMGLQPGDVDLSTTLTPDAVTACLTAGGIRVVDTGAEHGTVTAVAGGHGHEITTLREDVETRGRRAVVRFGTDWEADARRRDFTMNALYCDRQGVVFDPLGGYPDLVARRVRFIGDAGQRIAEDYLRILRFFRFFAWYGQGRPDAEGLKACVRLKGEMAILSPERIWMELKKLLAAPDPTRAVLWMRTSGVLAVVLPEAGNWGTDTVAKLVEGEAANPPDPLLRLMALLPPRPDTVQALATRLKLSRREQERLAGWAATPLPDMEADHASFLRLLYRGDPQAISDVLTQELARERSYRGATERAGLLAARLELARAWSRPRFPVAGVDIAEAGVRPGPRMGRLLTLLEDWWVERDFKPARDELLAEARRLAAGQA